MPETLEAALTLVSNALHMLQVPASRVIRTVGEIRRPALQGAALGDRPRPRRPRRRVRDLPRGAAHGGAAARRLVDRPDACSEIRGRGAEVSFTAVRRDGIVGRDPDPEMTLREGDVVVLFGTPEAQEHAEAVLLAG